MTGQSVRGFSLYELIITLCIASILGVTGSGIYRVLLEQGVTAEVNQLILELSLARSEAIKRRQEITLCPARDGRRCDTSADSVLWNNGGLLFIDTNDNAQLDAEEQLIQTHSTVAARTRIKSSASRPRIVYQPNGMSRGNTMTFTVCNPNNPQFVRYVIVSNTGRARTSSTPPDGKSDEPLERCS